MNVTDDRINKVRAAFKHITSVRADGERVITSYIASSENVARLVKYLPARLGKSLKFIPRRKSYRLRIRLAMQLGK